MVAPSRAIERGLMLPEDKPRALCEAMLPPPGGHGLVDPWRDEGKKKARRRPRRAQEAQRHAQEEEGREGARPLRWWSGHAALLINDLAGVPPSHVSPPYIYIISHMRTTPGAPRRLTRRRRPCRGRRRSSGAAPRARERGGRRAPARGRDRAEAGRAARRPRRGGTRPRGGGAAGRPPGAPRGLWTRDGRLELSRRRRVRAGPPLSAGGGRSAAGVGASSAHQPSSAANCAAVSPCLAAATARRGARADEQNWRASCAAQRGAQLEVLREGEELRPRQQHERARPPPSRSAAPACSGRRRRPAA